MTKNTDLVCRYICNTNKEYRLYADTFTDITQIVCVDICDFLDTNNNDGFGASVRQTFYWE